jgi:hypothetical protein
MTPLVVGATGMPGRRAAFSGAAMESASES